MRDTSHCHGCVNRSFCEHSDMAFCMVENMPAWMALEDYWDEEKEKCSKREDKIIQAQCHIYSCPFCEYVHDSRNATLMHILHDHLEHGIYEFEDIDTMILAYSTRVNKTLDTEVIKRNE